MLYTTYDLKENPSFKMDKKEFNTLVHSLVEESKGVETFIGLTIRTISSNRVCKMDDSVVLPIESNTHDTKGYFSLLKSIQIYLVDTIGDKFISSISKTVLMPVGAFKHEGKLCIYFTLCIDDSLEEYYTTSNLQFTDIESLSDLNSISKVVVPTLAVCEDTN